MEQATVHISQPGQTSAACLATEGDVITLEEAFSGDGRHFTCKACHQVLTGGRKHSRP